jgi:hypothetical protein
MSYHKQVHMIRLDLQRYHPPAAAAGLRVDQPLAAAPDPASQDRAAVHRAQHDVIAQITDATSGNLHLPGHARDYTHPLCQSSRFPRHPNTAALSRGA